MCWLCYLYWKLHFAGISTMKLIWMIYIITLCKCLKIISKILSVNVMKSRKEQDLFALCGKVTKSEMCTTVTDISSLKSLHQSLQLVHHQKQLWILLLKFQLPQFYWLRVRYGRKVGFMTYAWKSLLSFYRSYKPCLKHVWLTSIFKAEASAISSTPQAQVYG